MRRNALALVTAGLLTTAVACGAPVPDAVRPTIEWAAAKGMSCTYAWPEHERFAQWTCHARPDPMDRSVVVDGDGDGIISFIAQVAAPEGEVIVDGASALAVLDDTALTAPLNSQIRGVANDWIRANPDGGVTVLKDIRVSYVVDGDQLVLAFAYPPHR